MTTAEKWDLSTSLLHAVQTGIASILAFDTAAAGGQLPAESEASPKHLRVGASNAIISNGALLKALMDKGILTEDEFLDCYIKLLEEEVQSYEMQMEQRIGRKVSLS